MYLCLCVHECVYVCVCVCVCLLAGAKLLVACNCLCILSIDSVTCSWSACRESTTRVLSVYPICRTFSPRDFDSCCDKERRRRLVKKEDWGKVEKEREKRRRNRMKERNSWLELQWWECLLRAQMQSLEVHVLHSFALAFSFRANVNYSFRPLPTHTCFIFFSSLASVFLSLFSFLSPSYIAFPLNSGNFAYFFVTLASFALPPSRYVWITPGAILLLLSWSCSSFHLSLNYTPLATL